MGVCCSKKGEDDDQPERRSRSEKDDPDRRSTVVTVTHLVNIPFFAELNKKNLRELRNVFAFKTFAKDEVVAREGKEGGSAFHVVINGGVRIEAKDAQGASVQLKLLKSGDYFGEIELVKGDIQPVSAFATEDNTNVLVAKAEDFQQAVARIPELGVTVNVVGGRQPLRYQLKRIPFFSDISEVRLHLLATLCAVKTVKVGVKICTQGDDADGLYFIMSGRVEVSAIGSAETSNAANQVFLATLADGDYFGEIALLEKTRRTATVTSTQECTLLYLTREAFEKFIKVAPEVVQTKMFDTVVRRRTANSLKAIPMFGCLVKKQIGPVRTFDEKRLQLLGELFKFIQKAPGDTIFKEGDVGDAFYIIVRGKCSVTAKSPEGKDVFLNELVANDYFGETSLLNNTRCNATVACKSNTVLLQLKAENFQKFLTIAPEIMTVFKSSVSVRTSERMRKIPFFEAIKDQHRGPWGKLELLGSLFVFEEFKEGEVVFEEGTIGNKFYVMVAGEAVVTMKRPTGVITIDRIKPDGWFGEIALLKKTPRTATIRCSQESVLLSITADKFNNFLIIAPELAEPFHSLLQHRTANMLKTLRFMEKVEDKGSKPWSKLELFGSMFTYENMVVAGDVIYKPGDPGDRFYCVIGGQVKLTDDKDKKERLVDSHSGQHFGEADMVRKVARSQTAVAVSNTTLLSVGTALFHQMLRIAPQLGQYFADCVKEQTGEAVDLSSLTSQPFSDAELAELQATFEAQRSNERKMAVSVSPQLNTHRSTASGSKGLPALGEVKEVKGEVKLDMIGLSLGGEPRHAAPAATATPPSPNAASAAPASEVPAVAKAADPPAAVQVVVAETSTAPAAQHQQQQQEPAKDAPAQPAAEQPAALALGGQPSSNP